MDHILLEGHNTKYDDFSILIPENSWNCTKGVTID